MVEKEQALLARIIDLFAERFDKRAVLRGGMVLRLLGCERLTNDLDYVFVPFRSKKDIVADVVRTLREIPGAQVTHSLNSKCLRAIVTVDEATVQVEAKVALEAAAEILSTRELARAFGLPSRLVRVQNYSVALAHKMAAWNERRLIRDLYDIWFFLRMGVLPDPPTLEERLRRPAYSRIVPDRERFSGESVSAFYDFLRAHCSGLTDKDVADSLADYLAPEKIPGLAMAIRAELAKLRAPAPERPDE
ncbi:MAG: nucleotidyl transferase AbiEii/AbiGii toxin family protein [Kiritimatiellae bacterium]|nr:nucleotidyl transferase AbiEii/AbiGii toxin family protein [Kiritimatiellia bacterium]